jgi:hypothetical protein
VGSGSLNREHGSCFSCGHADLMAIFSLGAMPPVNAFVTRDEVAREERFPLDLYFCRRCTLVQLGEAVDPNKLFSHYLHMSSASPSNVEHLRSVADVARRYLHLKDDAKILEIGSNDGTLLRMLAIDRRRVIGVDPARNLADLSQGKGIETITAFFNFEETKQIKAKYGAFDAVIALNVVAHTPGFISLLKGVETILRPGGLFMMENAYAVGTILEGQFDTIYHEHVHNFSLHALCAAYERVGLIPIRAETIPTQGMSIRVIVGRAADAHAVDDSVKKILAKEQALGFTSVERFKSAAAKVVEFKQQLQAWVRAKKRAGKRIVGLGAPARGVVILNYVGLGPSDLAYIIDDTPLKQGRLTPGTHIEVADWTRLSREPADTFLVLSWNYRDNLLKRLGRYVQNGGALVPFPNFEEIRLGS